VDIDVKMTLEKRADDLIAQMTLEEKVSQMVYTSPAIERLGVPAYNWWNEALHGVGRAGVATVFPQAIGMAATWNVDLVHRMTVAASDEARAKHHEGIRKGIRQIYTGLTFWSPNVNIFRDPRWGRGQETFGEDPTLSAMMGVAFITGLQGDDPKYLKLVATPKHYAVHSGPEATRHHFDARVDERDIREFYFHAFEACIKVGKAASIMGAYNRVNGEPACASPFLLDQALREEWGFDGYVVSDCWAIIDIYEHHKVVNTAAEAAALAVRHGCDLNCGVTYPSLVKSVEQGLIAEEEIDRSLRRLLVARFKLGMFDPPEDVPYASLPYTVVDCPAHRELALQAARESIVLLKNEGDLLPLDRNLGSIAIIGPNAENIHSLLGNYNGTPSAPVTPAEGIRRKVSPSTLVSVARGCNFAEGIRHFEPIPSTCLRPLDPVSREHGLSGKYYDNPTFKGEPAFSRVDGNVDFVWKDSSPLSDQGWGGTFSIRWEGFIVPPETGSYRIGINGYSWYRLTLDGEALGESEFIHHPMLMEEAAELKAGQMVHVVIDYANMGLDPQVQLLWSPPVADTETVALEAAKRSDVIVAVMGLSPRVEGEEMPVQVDGFAGGDRTDIDLPAVQEELLKKLHALGKPVVLVLLNGSALAFNWAADHIPAIVEAWYPGQSGGEALADILFGDVNPSGKLPVTFYRSVDDLPDFDDYQLEGHTYRYFKGTPLYPFGYGLSYTTFRLDNLRLDQPSVEIGGAATIMVDITNTGERAGDEIVQLYTRDAGADDSAPLKVLRGFCRVPLQPGETRTVAFTLYTGQLGSYAADMRYMVNPGSVEVMVGQSSVDLALCADLTLTGEAADMTAEKVFYSTAKLI
jgi:beta-glucosidase